MACRFKELTDFIVPLSEDTYGRWIIDRKNDGSPEHPKQLPFVNYSEVVDRFVDTLYRFCDEHPEYMHTHYRDTLERNGLKWDARIMSEADVSAADANLVIALLIGAVRADRFCDGALLGFCKDGSIVRWLERLSALDARR